jgi:hypothetical protein
MGEGWCKNGGAGIKKAVFVDLKPSKNAVSYCFYYIYDAVLRFSIWKWRPRPETRFFKNQVPTTGRRNFGGIDFGILFDVSKFSDKVSQHEYATSCSISSRPETSRTYEFGAEADLPAARQSKSEPLPLLHFPLTLQSHSARKECGMFHVYLILCKYT